MRVSRLLVVTLGLLLALGLPGNVSAAHGQTAPQLELLAQTAPQLELLAQTPYVAADGELGMTLSWNGSGSDDVTLSARVFGAISNESQVSIPPVTETINRYPKNPQGISEVIDSEGLIQFTIPIRSFESNDERVLLREPGVYPIIVEVRDQTGPIATLRTHLIRLPTETAEGTPTKTNLIINVAAAEGIVITDAIPLLERHPSLPITVLLEKGVIPQLESDLQLAESFVAALNGRPVSAISGLDLDPSALAEINQPELYRAALERTTTRLSNLGLFSDAAILPVDVSLTSAGLDMLRSLGVEFLVDLSPSPGRGGSVAAAQGIRMITVDDRRTSELGGGIAGTHRLIASLALRSRSDALVLGGSELRVLDLAAWDVFFDALDQPGLTEAVDLRTAASIGSTVPIALLESPAQDLQPIASELSTFLERLSTYEEFYVNDGLDPGLLFEGLLASLTRHLNPEERSREIARLQTGLEDQLTAISLADEQSVTLTARAATVPLSVFNNSLGPRRVLLRFESDRIDVAQDGAIVELPPGRSSLDIEVETRALGLSPLSVQILTPDGSHELASTQYRIRSTAIPGLGYVLSGTALAFLILWWVRSISRSRKISSTETSRTAVSSTAVSSTAIQPGDGAGPEGGEQALELSDSGTERRRVDRRRST